MSMFSSLGGAMTAGGPSAMPAADSDFEKSFADLAYTYMRDKAPTLIGNMLGFEMLEHDEENDRAVGVFVFRLGEQEAMVPIFFLRGELKGYELLYLKGEDTFVPLSEKWINALRSRKPYTLGESSALPRSAVSRSAPDLQPFYRSPLSKTGSMFVAPPPFTDDRLLLKSLISLPPKFTIKLAAWMVRSPTIAQIFLEGYSMDDLRHVADQLTKRASEDIPMRSTPVQRIDFDRLQIIDSLNDPESLMLTDAQKEQLSKNRYVVIDDRPEDEVSMPIRVEWPKEYFSLRYSGFYDVLMDGDKPQRLLFLAGPMPIGKGFARMATLIDPEAKKFLNVTPTAVWAVKQHEAGWQTMFDKLPVVDSIEQGDVCVIVNRQMTATLPFKVRSRFKRSDGRVELSVLPADSVISTDDRLTQRIWSTTPTHESQPVSLTDPAGKNVSHLTHNMPVEIGGDADADTRLNDLFPQYREANRKIILSGRDGQSMVALGELLSIDEGCKVIKLTGVLGKPATGSLVDIEANAIKAGAVRVKIAKSFDDRLTISSPFGELNELTPIQAVRQLAGGFGVSGKVAQDMVQAAGRGPVRMLLKLAAGYPCVVSSKQAAFESAIVPDPQYAYDSRLGVMLTPPDEQTANITGALERPPDPFTDRDLYTMQAAQQTGQQSIVDAAVLGSLLRTSDIDDNIGGYLSDLSTGLDRLGRLLLMQYWFQEEFAERYGTNELVELTSSLKNVFEGLGDIVLFLRQREATSTDSMREIVL